jgi:hypothetical protein
VRIGVGVSTARDAGQAAVGAAAHTRRARGRGAFAGRPPLQRLLETVEVLPPDEQKLVSHGLQIGIVVDEHVAVPGRGDFMIRGLSGADPSTGAIKIGGEIGPIAGRKRVAPVYCVDGAVHRRCGMKLDFRAEGSL